jgi:hypothetical protein
MIVPSDPIFQSNLIHNSHNLLKSELFHNSAELSNSCSPSQTSDINPSIPFRPSDGLFNFAATKFSLTPLIRASRPVFEHTAGGIQSSALFESNGIRESAPFAATVTHSVAKEAETYTIMPTWLYAVIAVSGVLVISLIVIAIIWIRRRDETTTATISESEPNFGNSFTENFTHENHVFSNPLAEGADSDVSASSFEVDEETVTE